MRKILLSIVLVFAAVYAYAGETRLGVWVTVFTPERVLFSKENADKLVSLCDESGVKDIYLQVYRADKAYYDSAIADRTPYEELSRSAGCDVIDYLIEKAGDKNISVHAWINALSISQNKEANIIKKLGKGVLTVDQYGRLPAAETGKDGLDKYYIRENQLFLEPGDKRVRDYITSIAVEIVKRYPGLKGLQLDYVRYPAVVPFVPGSRFTSHGISYGYTDANLKAFKDSSGLLASGMEDKRQNHKKWDDWRRSNITELVRGISEKTRSVSPSIRISCTTVPSAERTYLTTFQDWTLWLKKGYVDNVTIMNYTDDPALMTLNSKSMMMSDVPGKVHIGIGSYLLKDDIRTLKEEILAARELAPGGIVLFSYDELAPDGDLRSFLSKNFGHEK